MTKTIYARVSDEAKDWLDEQARETGIPLAKIIDVILTEASRSGIRFELRKPILIRYPGQDPSTPS